MKNSRKILLCPNCRSEMRDGSKFCGICGINFFTWDVGWLLRRSFAGALAGGLGWIVSIGFLRMLRMGPETSLAHPFFGAMGGIFLGMAGGLVERSHKRVTRGIFAGVLSGIAGGYISGIWLHFNMNAPFVLSQVTIWGVVGLAVGAFCSVNAVWGAVAGLMAGALSGALGWDLSMALALEFKEPTWLISRAIEFLHGAVVGTVMWGGIAVADRVIHRMNKYNLENQD